MSEATAATTGSDEALLDELAGMLMSAARMAHARMEAAQDDKAFHAAGQTLHRMARSLRQTLALKQRSRRDAAQAVRDAEVRADSQRRRQTIRRQRVVADAVSRIVWTEHEDFDEDDAAPWFDEILERAEAESLASDFLDTPIPILVARICQAMGLPVPQAQPDHAAAEPPAEDVPAQNSG